MYATFNIRFPFTHSLANLQSEFVVQKIHKIMCSKRMHMDVSSNLNNLHLIYLD